MAAPTNAASEDSPCQPGANGMDPALAAVESQASTAAKEDVMQVVRIGLDLAKYVFEVHGVDNHGKVVVRKRLRRDAVAGFFANLPACLVGMEASNGAHYWARVLTELGHQVRLISPQFVTPYVNRTRTTRTMRKPPAKRSVVRPCASCHRNQPISWRY